MSVLLLACPFPRLDERLVKAPFPAPIPAPFPAPFPSPLPPPFPSPFPAPFPAPFPDMEEPLLLLLMGTVGFVVGCRVSAIAGGVVVAEFLLGPGVKAGVVVGTPPFVGERDPKGTSVGELVNDGRVGAPVAGSLEGVIVTGASVNGTSVNGNFVGTPNDIGEKEGALFCLAVGPWVGETTGTFVGRSIGLVVGALAGAIVIGPNETGTSIGAVVIGVRETGVAVAGASVTGTSTGTKVGLSVIGLVEAGGDGCLVGIDVVIIGARVGPSWLRQDS